MGTRVYEYGLLPPTENADLVSDGMYHAWRYKNDLIALEKERRIASSELISIAAGEEYDSLFSAFEEKCEQAAALREEIKAIKASAGQKEKDRNGEANRIIKEINESLKEINAEKVEYPA